MVSLLGFGKEKGLHFVFSKQRRRSCIAFCCGDGSGACMRMAAAAAGVATLAGGVGALHRMPVWALLVLNVSPQGGCRRRCPGKPRAQQ